MADFARSDHPAVQQQLDRLALISPAGDRLGLDRIDRLLDRLGRPELRIPPVFHVAGTNGKGSVCAFLRAALEASGLSVHMFTSPHLVRFNERIRIAGRLIEDERLAALLAEVNDCGEGIAPSFFEVTTAAALLAFARTPADACIVEVGLGGRLDSTNIIASPAVCAITGLGLDHQQFLGSDILSIAREKAGIAKSGVPLVLADFAPPVRAAILDVAQARGAVAHPAFGDWRFEVADGRIHYRDRNGGIALPLPRLEGEHQVANCALAVAMLRHQQSLDVPLAALQRMPLEARWPARFQRLGPGPLGDSGETWIDGAHNGAAAEALAGILASRGAMHIVLGILANKDCDSIVAALSPHALSLTFIPVPGHDHHDPDDLAGRHAGQSQPSLEAALSRLPGPRLVAGSLYLAGEALRLNREFPD